MATLKEIVIMYQSLKREWDKKPTNLDRCGELLSKLKIALTQVSFLPTDDTAPSKQELLVARDILEVGAQWAIAKQDIPAFERYMAQLKCYYMDYKDNLPESTYKYQLLGLNLLCLLSQNRLAEFHTELELLPVKELQNNIYIKHPVSMEQYLMEGFSGYPRKSITFVDDQNVIFSSPEHKVLKVFLARGNVPADNYNFFIDILLNTIRNEIALCIEKAYEKIGLNEAARMLFYESVKHMKDYAEQVGKIGLNEVAGLLFSYSVEYLKDFAEQRKWELKSDGFFYFKQEEKETDEVIPAKDLAEQTIAYARELEMIV